jgi:hypothetical protein
MAEKQRTVGVHTRSIVPRYRVGGGGGVCWRRVLLRPDALMAAQKGSRRLRGKLLRARACSTWWMRDLGFWSGKTHSYLKRNKHTIFEI